jgi:hypothetical protein
MRSQAAFLSSMLLKSRLARLNVKKETVPGRHIGGAFCRLRLSPVRKSGGPERPNLQGRGLRWYGFLWFLIVFLPISNPFPLNAQGG